MANEFYNRGANFNPDELADGDAIESEFDAVARGFDKINTAIDTDRAGYPTQAFHVAPATEPTHAVQKAQLELKADASSVNSALALKADASSVNSRIGSDGGISFRNKIVDGRFDFWYEGATQSANGYGSDTMWFNANIGSTKVHSQQPLVAGVDLPAIEVPTAKYFSRTVVTSVAGASNYATKFHNMEGVRTLAGKTVTVSFYAKADAVKNIALTMAQVFGTGGSSLVNGIGAQLISLSTTWKRYTAQITLPSISGKTVGTANDYIQLCFWFDAGSSSIGAILGQQSGTFDIACVQLEEGSVMTPFEELPIEISQQRVNRYYESSYSDGAAIGSASATGQVNWQGAPTTTNAFLYVPFKVRKRIAPAISIYALSSPALGYLSTSAGNLAAAVLASGNTSMSIGYGGSTSIFYFACQFVADARL